MPLLPRVEIPECELRRLQECENAWIAVYNQLLAFNPEFSRGANLTGKQCALVEIMRLQLAAHRLNGEGHNPTLDRFFSTKTG